MFGKFQTARGTHVILPVVIGLFVLLALLREAYIEFNMDNGWLLYAAGRFIDGDRLYVDLLETNPPLIIYMYTLPVYLSRLVHVDAMSLFPWLVSALSLLVLVLVADILKRQRFMPAQSAQASLVFFALALFVLPVAIYGEREYLWVALILPYLVQSLDPDAKSDRSMRGIWIAAMAAVGFALKPYFLLVWLANEGFLALALKKARRFFSCSNLIIGLFQIAYVLFISLFTPEYFTIVAPMAMHTYFAFNSAPESVREVVGSIVALVIGIMLLSHITGVFKRISYHLLTLVIASGVVVWLQHKVWLYQVYPFAFMAGWYLTLMLMHLISELRRLKNDIGHAKFSALCLCVAGFAVPFYMVGSLSFRTWNDPHIMRDRLVQEIRRYAAHEYVYPLSFNLGAAFPAINYSDGIFEGRFHHLWPLPGIILQEQKDSVTTPDAKIPAIKQFVIDTLVADFQKNPPALVWVDKNSQLLPTALHGFNVIAFLSKDPRFAALWSHYQWLEDVEDDSEETMEKTSDGKIFRPVYAFYRRAF